MIKGAVPGAKGDYVVIREAKKHPKAPARRGGQAEISGLQHESSKIQDLKGGSQGELEVKFPLIADGKGTQAVHDTVVAYQAAQRSGTACTKNVGEVAGTNKKPWRQKGTGRARAGSFQSPLWRGGGVVFGPKPRDFGKKVSRGTRQLSLRKALSERLDGGRCAGGG